MAHLNGEDRLLDKVGVDKPNLYSTVIRRQCYVIARFL